MQGPLLEYLMVLAILSFPVLLAHTSGEKLERLSLRPAYSSRN